MVAKHKSENIYKYMDLIIPKNVYKYKIIEPEALYTSEEWQNQFPNPRVLDPDGWDRKNYQYSWFQKK